jgi:hypothetical protein
MPFASVQAVLRLQSQHASAKAKGLFDTTLEELLNDKFGTEVSLACSDASRRRLCNDRFAAAAAAAFRRETRD